MNIYDFTVKNNAGEDVDLSTYEGKVLLIVNTATQCGLTPQYDQLEELYKDYKERGLVVMDFPCNQFLAQAPGSDEEIQSFCLLNYSTTFPRFQKLAVNGEEAHPLFAYLKAEVTETEDEHAEAFKEKIKNVAPFTGETDIKWNFTKFLIDRSGHVVGRFSPTYTPETLKSQIEKLIQ